LGLYNRRRIGAFAAFSRLSMLRALEVSAPTHESAALCAASPVLCDVADHSIANSQRFHAG
jgi:hypothetical protein